MTTNVVIGIVRVKEKKQEKPAIWSTIYYFLEYEGLSKCYRKIVPT